MSMRAWQVVRHGSPAEALRLGEVAVPDPGPGQVRVAVRAAAVNFADTLLCSGEYQVRPELPFVPGLEVCGVVTAVGEGVSTPAVGDRVLGMTALPHGGFADEALMDAATAYPAPASLTDAQAAAFVISHHTGWLALHRRAAIRPGEHLLVHAATGGVGSAAVQLGRAAGAHVIGVVGGPQKADLARRVGCDVVVDRRSEDVAAAVLEATGGHGADVVYDPVGGPAFEASTHCVALEGRILVVGFASGTRQRARLDHALVKGYSVLGLNVGRYREELPDVVRACHAALVEIADAGHLDPLVGTAHPFAEVPQALASIAGGTTSGRPVVVP